MRQTYLLLASIAALAAAASASTTMATPNGSQGAFPGEPRELKGNDVIASTEDADEDRINLSDIKRATSVFGEKVKQFAVDDYNRDIGAEFTKLGLDKSNLFAHPYNLDKWFRIVHAVSKVDNPNYAIGRELTTGSSVDAIWKQLQLAKQDSELSEHAKTVEAGLIAKWALRGDSLESVLNQLKPNFDLENPVDKVLTESPLDTLIQYAKKLSEKKAVRGMTPDTVEKEAAESLFIVLHKQLREKFLSKLLEDDLETSLSKEKSEMVNFIRLGRDVIYDKAQKAAKINGNKDSIDQAPYKSSEHVMKQQLSSHNDLTPPASFQAEHNPALRPHTPPSDLKELPISSKAAPPPTYAPLTISHYARFRRWLSHAWAKVRAALWPFNRQRSGE